MSSHSTWRSRYCIHHDLSLSSSDSLLATTERELLVSDKLGVKVLENRLLGSLRLLDTVAVSLLDLVVVCVVLGLRHLKDLVSRL